MNLVCIDGEFVPAAEAKISVWDHGYLYGDGLFETMRAYQGNVFAVKEHLARLRRGAEMLQLKISQTDEKLNSLLHETIERNGLSEAYIRLTYSRGPGPIGIDPALCPRGTLVIMAKALELPEKLYRQGTSLGICPIRRNHSSALPPAMKSLNFLNNIIAKIWAKEHGHAEALLLTQEGWIAETTVSNIFFIINEEVFTPSLDVGILPGITKAYVSKAITQLNLSLQEGFYSLNELFEAEEIFLTNSGNEIVPVTTLDGKVVGTGLPGRLTQVIHDRFKDIVLTSLKLN